MWTVELLPGGIIWIVTPLAVFERRTVNTWIGYWMVWPPPAEADDPLLADWLEDEARRWVAAELERHRSRKC